jgi:Uncharacterised protein family (UPF0158)
MDKKPVKLSDLVQVLEFDLPEHITKVDLQDGRVVTVDEFVMRAVEEGDEESLSGLPDWQKEELEIARAMMDDAGERFVDAPDKFEFHEYRQMERFIGTLDNSEGADQLWQAIKGKGAFRYFKDTAHRLGLLEEWYQYRDNAMKQFIQDWAEANQIPVQDDTPRNRKP